MAKRNAIKVRIISTAGTGYYKVIYKNAKKLVGKLSFRKYDPIARKHVLFEEKKMPPHSK